MSGFQDDPLVPPGCYSELQEIPVFETDAPSFDFTTTNTPFSDYCNNNSPRMLCFGDYANVKMVVDKETGQRSGFACTASKPGSLPNKTKRKRDGSGRDWNSDLGIIAGAPSGKRVKSDSVKITGGRAKVSKKEKLGERITALQQIVSPFGKTDTASVLHEAFGYIKFLQDQVQVLSSPYLKCSTGNGDIEEADKKEHNLRSRGLCLVPVELTMRVADSNGADLWSSAAMINNVSSNL